MQANYSVIQADELRTIYWKHNNAVLLQNGTILTTDYESKAIAEIENFVASSKVVNLDNI